MNKILPQSALVFSGVRGDTRRYRTLHLYEQLRLAGVDCTLSHLTDPRLPDQVQRACVAILHRVAYDDYVARLLDQLRTNGALVILDADDFLYDPAMMQYIDSPDFQDPVRANLYRKELLRHRATLEHCDAITVSTNYLAGMMEPFGQPVAVHRNAFSLEMLALSKAAVQQRVRPDGKMIIGYASGTRTHDRDFALIQPALVEVLSRFPQVELWLMGSIDPGKGWGRLQEQVRSIAWVPWRQLPERLALLDINLAPLVQDNPFNQSKSEIKYMEAALVGVPTIASPTDAFSYAIRHGQNGLLANSLEEWQTALEHLITDSAARDAIGTAACQDVLASHAPWLRGPALLQTLSRFSSKSGITIPDFPLNDGARDRFFFSAADEEHPKMHEMACYSIRYRGVTTLIKQIWVYFRRMISPVFPFQSTGNK